MPVHPLEHVHSQQCRNKLKILHFDDTSLKYSKTFGKSVYLFPLLSANNRWTEKLNSLCEKLD